MARFLGLQRVLRLFRSPREEAADEIAAHLALAEEELLRQGLTRCDARAEALRRFGDPAAAVEACRAHDESGKLWRSLARGGSDLVRDLGLAARQLRRAPSFAVAALVALALGIGACTAVFSVVSAVLLRPLPFQRPERLVRLFNGQPARNINRTPFSFPDFEDLRAQAGVFEGAAACYMETEGLILSGEGDPQRLQTGFVSGDFFRVLGVKAKLGRVLARDDDRRGFDRVLVLSHALWRGRFGGDPGIVGSTLRLDGKPFTVVGVAPPEMRFPAEGVEAWAPLSLIPDSAVPRVRGVHWLDAVARLRDGVALLQAQREADAFAARLAAEHPKDNAGYTAMPLVPLADELLGPVRAPLLVLLGAVGLVLLVACVNVSTLLLARASTRGRELAVRAALGAGRGRLLRQLLAESALLAALGGGLGVLLSAWALDALVALARHDLPRAADIHLDLPVLIFAVSISLAAGIGTGLLPALRSAKADLGEALRDASAAKSSGRLRALLVTVEVGLATVLVLGAGLLLTSLARLSQVDPGFRAEQALLVRLVLPEKSDREFLALYDRLVAALSQVPTVTAVGGSKSAPLRGNGGERYSFAVAGEPDPGLSQRPIAEAFPVSPGFFRAMGIPLHAGRDFAAEEKAHVVIVSQELARRHLGGRSALGRALMLGPVRYEVVGIAGDVRGARLDRAPEPVMYLPVREMPRIAVALVVRTSGSPAALAKALREAVRAVDKDLPVTEIATLDQVVADAMRAPRFLALVMALFGVAALALAVVGIYGVVAYAVGSRTKEIAIRRALGATAREVIAQAMRRGLASALVGLGAGLLGSLLAARALQSLLYQTSAADPATYCLVGAGLALAAAAGAYLPARRAARIDPMQALRAE